MRMLTLSKALMMHPSCIMFQVFQTNMLPKVSNRLSTRVLEFGARAASEMLLVHGGHKQLSSRHALSRKHFIKHLRVTMLHNGNLQCPQSTNRS
jgi:ABC-type branched-subunit amino acid transport system ATPase component